MELSIQDVARVFECESLDDELGTFNLEMLHARGFGFATTMVNEIQQTGRFDLWPEFDALA